MYDRDCQSVPQCAKFPYMYHWCLSLIVREGNDLALLRTEISLPKLFENQNETRMFPSKCMGYLSKSYKIL